MWQLQQLEQFRAVYEHGSLSAAARALGLSQPALSRSLQKLEATLGMVLFQRHTRQLRPTEFAHVLYRQATKVLRETAGLGRLVERFHAGREGMVRLGCGPFVPDILSHSLIGWMQRYDRHVHLDLQTDHFEALREGLYGYRYDFLVYDGRRRQLLPDDDDVVVEPLLTLPLKAVVPARWLRGEADAARHDEDAARQLMATHPWALPRVAPEYGSYAKDWFYAMLRTRRGGEFILPTFSTCLALCRAGHALTLAPEMLVVDDLAAGLLVALPVDMGGTVQTSAYRLRSRPLSEAAGWVWRLMVNGGVEPGG